MDIISIYVFILIIITSVAINYLILLLNILLIKLCNFYKNCLKLLLNIWKHETGIKINFDIWKPSTYKCIKYN